jgi:hypothetical protein
MKKLGLISVYLDQNTPAQQLLDRCLTGWPSEGRSFESPFESVLVHGLSRKTLLESRKGATKLVVVDNMKDVLKEVDCWISAPGKENSWACCSQYTQFIADNYGSSKPGWVVGPSGGLSQEVMSSFVKEGRMQVQFSTPLPWTWRLPEQNIPVGADLKEVIVLVRGAFPYAEQEGLDALLALTAHRRGGESGIANIKRLEGAQVWKAAREGKFSWDVFSAAVSRTNSKLGDATSDGRTQDIVGLGMIPNMAKGTRAWILEHNDGLKSTVITMDGVLNDDHFAAQTKDGSMVSAQFYRPPKPNDHQYSRLMERIIPFLEGKDAAWPLGRTLLWSTLINHMQTMESEKTTELNWRGESFAYSVKTPIWKP